MKKSLIENDREVVCIAFVDGITAGYCSGLIVKSMCYSENRADIESLYVKEEFRGNWTWKNVLSFKQSQSLNLG